ncbi:FK506-binding protein [Sparassis crispa]|uniref:FK506-binding protein n=1 Tax=Sparassis crispa TaxID=139825 RepID=A0A401GGR9_9APHY|nr:FK506-binding protein [Sparassis crispa]GBE81394.1 FK506-binding protein [Sparassis crispa]
MALAIAVWSIAAKPGEPTAFSPAGDLRITNVALGDQLADETGRTVLKLVYQTAGAPEEDDEDEESVDIEPVTSTVICSLTPGKIEQATVDLVLEGEQDYLLEIVGKNTLYLTGNYIDQMPSDQPPYDDESDLEEDAFHLDEVSSDVEVHPDEMDIVSEPEARIEEIHSGAEEGAAKEKAPKKDAGKKRPREEDEADGAPEKISKAERKKRNKKLKAEGGQAVAPPTEEKPAEKKEKKEKKEKVKVKGVEGEKTEGKKEKGEKEKGETKVLEGGVKIYDHKVGTGPQAKKGDRVAMRYIGKLENGKVFDQNSKGKPFSFHLGGGEVIKGWDVGIVGMHVGGERLLTIPAPMAYGKQKQTGIPANSTLTFEVKLVGIN